ncbi:MAG TPA: hypothetical protein EYG86_06535 [Crocinitomicaceae bacterium]|nr:hypothetical protein [Crocinitomicaceae bacterium]
MVGKSSCKFLVVISVFCGSVLLSSCEDKPNIDETDVEVNDDYYEFQDFNLAQYDIPAMISLPDETANIGASTKPEVIHTESDIKWTLKVGQNFELEIEDYADVTDLIEVEKKELADKDFYKINYIIDEKDLILYERTLVVKGTDNASPTVGVEHKSYHVYGQKIVNGLTYELSSREEGYEKMIIELMAKSIKSFKPIKKS